MAHPPTRARCLLCFALRGFFYGVFEQIVVAQTLPAVVRLFGTASRLLAIAVEDAKRTAVSALLDLIEEGFDFVAVLLAREIQIHAERLRSVGADVLGVEQVGGERLGGRLLPASRAEFVQ